MKKKRIKANLLIVLLMGVVTIFSVRTYAVSPPFMSLNTSLDVITFDNAVLHANLFNSGVEITGFEIFVYKDNVLIKNGFKRNAYSGEQINIVFDLKKDLSIVLLPNTTYTYTICAKSDSDINKDMYKQSFHFTTTDIDVGLPRETTSKIVNAKKPGVVKIKSIKNNKKRKVILKYKKTKNVKKYQIKYSTNKKFKKAVIKNTKKLSFVMKKLKIGRTYYIRIRGLNGDQKGQWSKIKRVTIKK